MDPEFGQLINRRLETILNQMEGVTDVEEKAKPYLLNKDKVATAVVHGAILNTQSKDHLRKTLAWIARYAGDIALYNAVLRVLRNDKKLLEHPTAIYCCMEFLCAKLPNRISQLGSKLTGQALIKLVY